MSVYKLIAARLKQYFKVEVYFETRIVRSTPTTRLYRVMVPEQHDDSMYIGGFEFYVKSQDYIYTLLYNENHENIY